MELKLQPLRVYPRWRVDWNGFYEEDINEENAWASFSSSCMLNLTNEQNRRNIDLCWCPEGDLNGNYIISVSNIVERYDNISNCVYNDFEEIEQFKSKNRIEIVEKIEELMSNLGTFQDERIYKSRGIIDSEAEEIRQKILKDEINYDLIKQILKGEYAQNQNLLLDFPDITKEIVLELSKNGRNKGVRKKAEQKLKSQKYKLDEK